MRKTLTHSVVSVVAFFAVLPACGQICEEPKQKPKKPAKKPAVKMSKEERLRAEIASELPAEKGTEILVFVTIEKTQQPLIPNSKKHSSLTVTRTAKKAHRMDDRDKAIDFLTKWMLELPTDSSGASTPKTGGTGALKTRRRSWAFENAFPRNNEGAKDADDLAKKLAKRFLDDEQEEARKTETRRKLFEGGGS